MQISSPVSDFLGVLERVSNATLVRRDDLAAVLEAAFRSGRKGDLEELAFLGKFCVRAFGIMKRVGPQGDGYSRLAAELEVNTGRARALFGLILAGAPEETRSGLSKRYLSMTVEGVENLMALLSDLSWVKNWQIDNPGKSPW